MMRKLAVLSVGLLLAGCETVQAPTPPPPPLPTASLDGVAQFHVTEDRTGTCSGFSVALVAETAKSRSRMTALYGSSEHVIDSVGTVKARSAGLPAGEPPIGSAQCDSHGAFEFPRIEPGDYYLIAHLKLLPGGQAADDLVLLQRVVVRPGEARHVRLAP